jgi:hypothetical protein
MEGGGGGLKERGRKRYRDEWKVALPVVNTPGSRESLMMIHQRVPTTQ